MAGAENMEPSDRSTSALCPRPTSPQAPLGFPRPYKGSCEGSFKGSFTGIGIGASFNATTSEAQPQSQGPNHVQNGQLLDGVCWIPALSTMRSDVLVN